MDPTVLSHLTQARHLLSRLYEALVLVILYENGPMRWSEVGRAMDRGAEKRIDDRTISRTLETLRDAGYVTTADSGATHMLTETGVARARQIASMVAGLHQHGPDQHRPAPHPPVAEEEPRTAAHGYDDQPSLRPPLAWRDHMSDPTASQQRPTSAGMYDFFLGGTAHSPADRAAAEQITQLVPEIADAASANRGFLQRAVKKMAEYGIRQFIDLGSGLPTQRNTHDVVPDGRVVYVDIDPAVAVQARGMVADMAGVTVIEGDIRQPDAILGHPETHRLIDFDSPVGLLMVAVLHFVPDDDDPWSLVARYLDAVPSGSYLALSHASMADLVSDQARDTGTQVYAATATPPTDRTKTEIARFFTGLEIVPPYQGADPTLAYVGLWGADAPEYADTDGSHYFYAAVARKP